MNSGTRIIAREAWQPWLLRLLALAVFAALPACSGNDDGAQGAEGGDAQPFAELFDQGITRSLGSDSPIDGVPDMAVGTG